MPSTLSAQGIIQRAYDSTNNKLKLLNVGTASAYVAPADLSIQGILERCFVDATEQIRVVRT